MNSSYQKIIRLALPIIIGQLGYVLMGWTDNLMVGKLGPSAIAAVGICNSIFITVTIIGLGLFTVISPLISHAKTKGELERCGNILKSGIGIALLLSVLLMAVLYFLCTHFSLFGQPADVAALSPGFLKILTLSTLPLFLFLALKQFTDGLSLTLPAMYITLGAVAFNALLNYVFIYGHLGAPALGVKGAALSTLIARTLMAAAMFAYVLSARKTRPYKPLDFHAHHAESFWEIVRMGLPSGLQNFFEVGAFSLAAVWMGHLGTAPLAAHQIAISLASLTFMMTTGIGAAAAITVGEAMATRHTDNAWNYGQSAITIAALFMAVCGAIFWIFNFDLAGIYVQDAQVRSITASLLIVAALFQLSDGIQCVALGALRGLSDVRIPTFITLLSYWIVALPLGYFLSFTLHFGYLGIWIGLLVGLSVSACLLTYRFWRLTQHLPSIHADKGL